MQGKIEKKTEKLFFIFILGQLLLKIVLPYDNLGIYPSLFVIPITAITITVITVFTEGGVSEGLENVK